MCFRRHLLSAADLATLKGASREAAGVRVAVVIKLADRERGAPGLRGGAAGLERRIAQDRRATIARYRRAGRVGPRCCRHHWIQARFPIVDEPRGDLVRCELRTEVNRLAPLCNGRGGSPKCSVIRSIGARDWHVPSHCQYQDHHSGAGRCQSCTQHKLAHRDPTPFSSWRWTNFTSRCQCRSTSNDSARARFAGHIRNRTRKRRRGHGRRSRHW